MEGSIHTTKPQKPTTIEKNQEEDPNKFYYHFLYKTTIVLIFFVILPLFPSQAPEFINQNLLTKNWELLHLLFVGIAISYGIFSRRNQNDETDKENNNNSKFDTAQSLVSRFLQVSSFFEDEVENNNHSDETKVQTWNNQHYRNKPVVVVHSDFQNNNNSVVPDKPLLLPVRSLKSRLSDDDDEDSTKVDKSCIRSFSFDSSRGSKRLSNNSNKARNEEIEEMKENVVLASPIPWRSRSARMEHKQEGDDNNNTSVHDQKASRSSMEESVKSQLRSQTYSRSSTKQMTSRSPPPPPPPMVSKESLGKNAEDLLKKKSFHKFPSPPPPPPPPPMVPKQSVGKNAEDLLKKKSFYKFSPPPPPPPPPTMFQKSIYMKKPPRYGYAERISMAKHDKPIASFSREIGKEGKNEDEEGDGNVPLVSEEEKESFLDTESEDENDDVGEGRTGVHSENGEGFKTDNEASSSSSSSSSLGTVVVGDEGPDVDKKADEFIAKFREQIRLQRIQSIKNSTTRIARNSSR